MVKQSDPRIRGMSSKPAEGEKSDYFGETRNYVLNLRNIFGRKMCVTHYHAAIRLTRFLGTWGRFLQNPWVKWERILVACSFLERINNSGENISGVYLNLILNSRYCVNVRFYSTVTSIFVILTFESGVRGAVRRPGLHEQMYGFWYCSGVVLKSRNKGG